MKKILSLLLISLILFGCGTLDKKTILISPGDTKEQVLSTLGTPKDRQFQGKNEAWQYCVSGAGFGYNDHKIIWMYDGRVTGIRTYTTSCTGCRSCMRTIKWEDKPDISIEMRDR